MKRFYAVLLIALFYLSIIGWAWQKPLAKKNNEGVRLYKEGKMDDALSKWRDAQIDSPDREELLYNIGSALYEQKKYEDASNEYEKSLGSKDAELHAKTYYNMGNSFYRMDKLPEAIEYYKKALGVNPDDEDAKYNIEFVRKKIKENPEKQESQESSSQEQQKGQQKQGQDEKQDSQAQQQESGEAEKGEEEKDGEDKKEAQSKGEEQEETGSEKKKQEESDREEGKMSEEDALRLLDALKDDEKNLQKELRTQPGEGIYNVEKDW